MTSSFSTAGAMRLPLTADKDRPIPEMLHYLTDYYAEKKFNLKPIPFNNHSDNAFYNFYGNPIKMKGKIVNNIQLAAKISYPAKVMTL